MTWQDFSERESATRISELKYYLGYNTDKQRYGDTIVQRNIARCYMIKSLSFINPVYKTEEYLRYNQVIFDIVEIHRRRFQFELDRINSYNEIKVIFNHIYTSCNNEINKFITESNDGQDLKTIDFWEQKTLLELKYLPDIKIPEIENINFGYALYAGFGAGSFTGSLGEHFAPTFNFMFGFDFAYKKSILYLNGTLAVDKVQKEYISDKNWHKGQRTNVAIIDVSFGYALIYNQKIKLSPFAGLGITEFTEANKDDEENRLRIVDYNLIFGINTDYKIRTRLILMPNSIFGVKEKIDLLIRARLFITRAYYYEDLQGYSVNLTIGLCGFGNKIRLK